MTGRRDSMRICDKTCPETYLQARAFHQPLTPFRVIASSISNEVKAAPHHCCKALLLHDQLQGQTVSITYR